MDKTSDVCSWTFLAIRHKKQSFCVLFYYINYMATEAKNYLL